MAISPSGTWTYRSLLNNPDPNVPFNDLAFGVGTLVLEDDGAGGLSATAGRWTSPGPIRTAPCALRARASLAVNPGFMPIRAR